MLIIYGLRFYGRLRECGSSYIATRFFHIWYVPLFPVGSQLILRGGENGSLQGISVPFNFTSMLAAYLRVWGPIALLATVASGIGAVGEMSSDPVAMIIAGVFTGVVSLALLAGTILAYAVMGRLSEDDKRKRSVYAMHTGYFVDPADMGDAKSSIRDTLFNTIVERARGLASMGYRLNADPSQAWAQVALDPTHRDDALITAAFTLARLEASTPGPQQIHMEQLHQQLWQRIVQQNPPYLTAHAQAA